jgi:NAD(P)-dependent dehydrogenase (short-subunit alcohol dehydrogenase family)
MDELRLDGKIALVTGASRGIGRAVALGLARAGADVAVCARDAGELAETGRAIEALGRRTLVVPTDVTDEAQVEDLAEAVVETFARIDILVNNSGTVLVKPLLDTETADWRRVIDTNLTGTYLCCRALGAHMVAQHAGRVVNIASVDGLKGSANVTAYSASKGGVVALTRALALEWARHGVTVNAVAPGYIDTAMSRQGLDDPATRERILKLIPMRRVGEPSEIAPLVVYLASDAAAYVTGAVVVIDGGQLAR